ncbi:haptoglobin-like [Arapaima gigas]
MRSPLAKLLLLCGVGLASVMLTEARRPRRMVGGRLAPVVPWQAMVFLGDSILNGGFGGGALISKRWVLTAGRNIFHNKTREASVRSNYMLPKVFLGVYERSQMKPSDEVAVEKVVLHPDFQKTSDWDNDLALIKLKEPVTYSKTVMPIPLPERGEDLVETNGTRGLMSGWGFGIHLTFSDPLKVLVLEISNQEDCKEEYSKGSNLPVVDERVFCTHPKFPQENLCFGDAGGAFVVHDDATSRVYAAGILSFDKTCTLRTHAVYMKLSAYLPWINSVLREDEEELSRLRSSYFNTMFSKQIF